MSNILKDQVCLITVRKDVADFLCKALSEQFNREFNYETEPEAIGACIFTPKIDHRSGPLTPALKHHIRFYIKGILLGIYLAIKHDIRP